MNTLFPLGEFEVDFGVPGLPTDENEPGDVDDDGKEKEGDYDHFLILGIKGYSHVVPGDVGE